MLKVEAQLAIHCTDQSKFFTVMVLVQYATQSYASHCAILGCFGQIRTSSVTQEEAGHALLSLYDAGFWIAKLKCRLRLGPIAPVSLTGTVWNKKDSEA
jgi:hypothetical protein